MELRPVGVNDVDRASRVDGAKAIEDPFGDQLGCMFWKPPLVICTGAEPSSRTEKSSQETGGPGTGDAYASCVPLGDHTGGSFSRPSVVIRLTSPPAALAV
jgi:hypothetical protein